MKEKIMDLFNGVFVYRQLELTIEPSELVLKVKKGETFRGSFVISSCDERRVKGIVCARIPGMVFRDDGFFARNSRIEFTYTMQGLREGETLTEDIWLETNAGEYRIPVQITVDSGAKKVEEEQPLPELIELPQEIAILKKGKGRSEAWRAKRRQEAACVELCQILERERRKGCTKEDADICLRVVVDRLLEEDRDSLVYPLLDAWVLLREGQRKKAREILRTYDNERLYQTKDITVRALFLYLNSLYQNKEETTDYCVTQLQKIYQRHPEHMLVTEFLLKLDVRLQISVRARFRLLERLFLSGCRHRLLYQEAFCLLRDDPALFTQLDAFTLQSFGWAASYGLITKETAQAVAIQATRLKRWTPLASKVLKACWEVSPSKETIGAVCSIYIRGNRTDEEAFSWYEKGVEYDAKITNLYEYYIYALPENYKKLLPRQVLLYFHYHNTLNNHQRTILYCNLVKYGHGDKQMFREHSRALQDFLLRQLADRRLNESLAWLYQRCVLVEALEDHMLEALADILFLRKLTVEEKRIREVEVSYEQLQETFTYRVSNGCAWIPVYTPNVKIVLIDTQKKRYYKTVAYQLLPGMQQPKFLQICIEKLKDHLGINLYQLDGKGKHSIREENLSVAWKLMKDERVRESYRLQLKLEVIAYERKSGRLEQMEESLSLTPGEVERLPRKGQGAYIEILILLHQDIEAWKLLLKTRCMEVDAKILLCLLQRLMAKKAVQKEELMPLARQVLKKGVYTEKLIKLLATETRGNTEELLKLWQAGAEFHLALPELSEQLIVQALFTERYVKEVFPVFAALDDRGGQSVIGSAYLNYLSFLDFVKGFEVPEGLLGSLEHHLSWEDALAEVAVLCYLKELSALLLLTETQKRLVRRLLKELPLKHRCFSFIQKLLPYGEEDRPADQTIVEYRCNPEHKVVLHYVLEYHGQKSLDYITERLYPVCQGVFTKAFILFYGERLSWFFTETLEDGSKHSTECITIEHKETYEGEDSRYHRLCQMQRALDNRQEDRLASMMEEYESLIDVTEEQFHMI